MKNKAKTPGKGSRLPPALFHQEHRLEQCDQGRPLVSVSPGTCCLGDGAELAVDGNGRCLEEGRQQHALVSLSWAVLCSRKGYWETAGI